MTICILRLDILQPGSRADELLSAIAASFGREWTGPDLEGRATFQLEMPYPVARQRAERIIHEHGDDGQFIVRVPG